MNPLFQQQWRVLLNTRTDLTHLTETVSAEFDRIYAHRHGHFDDWLAEIEQVSKQLPVSFNVDCHQPVVTAAIDGDYQFLIEPLLTMLMPWRKGPFALAGVDLDCEWRSDWKYQRLLETGFEVKDKTVLDVGTGNGYFLYRFLGSGARLAVGIDPSWHYFAQFHLLQHFMQQDKVVFLPMTLNEAPLTGFDCVLSMGVLYHRRDPLTFLTQLRDCVRPGGQLVVETLVVDGNDQTVYMPEKCYAGMCNVWFLPSPMALAKWLERLGLIVEYVSEPATTTIGEQRKTRWMQSYSLSEFLQAGNDEPPPKRAILIARKK